MTEYRRRQARKQKNISLTLEYLTCVFGIAEEFSNTGTIRSDVGVKAFEVDIREIFILQLLNECRNGGEFTSEFRPDACCKDSIIGTIAEIKSTDSQRNVRSTTFASLAICTMTSNSSKLSAIIKQSLSIAARIKSSLLLLPLTSIRIAST